ncbi:MAG: helix-hairpin-helix domain-containing protein [Betaproteobacteria bacterium]|nr:helix-hairpin-helix domain-containing protein [Betaproteobacteria bacterium]MBA3774838.1 helix-hairpin-helix domain-containing protein [Betaproteobacteria bacterium]
MHRIIGALALALVSQLFVMPPADAAVNLNTASKDELVALVGIGPAKAQAILDYRRANGPFKTVDDVKNVKGIGAKRLEKFKDQLTVAPAPQKVAATQPVKQDTKAVAAAAMAKGEIKGTADVKPKK